MHVVDGLTRCQRDGSRRSLARSVRLRAAPVAAAICLLGAALQTAGAQEWHELYADGKQALRNGQVERAVRLLRGAIQKRPQPGVSVPTYGTNFEPQYFPYLRLAEAYVRLESYEEALKVLETSARFAVEPAAERAALENRVKTVLDARRVAPTNVQVRTPASSAGPPPPIPQPQVSVPAAEPKRDVVVPRAETTTTPLLTPRTSASETSRPRLPVLDLTTQPAGAHVFVDDEPVGTSDPQTGRLRLTTLRPGTHRLRISAQGHDDLVRELVLATEPISFHGVLSVSSPRPANEPVPPQADSYRTIWALVGVGLLIVLVLIIWMWRRGRSGEKPVSGAEVARQPSPPKSPGALPGSESVSFENFPVDFGDYRLIRRIGKGGMATVYEAERRTTGEKFALKRPLAGFLDDHRFLERFTHEAELGRALHHPNIVRIVDRGQVGASPYFAMELIEGESLRERLDREGRLDAAFAVSVTARVAEALDYAHHKGVIHRDLKPGNIMLERSGGLKVMDYGIARAQFREGLTTTGGFLGTPQYAAPEAAEGRTEPRSDLYSLGVVFFEMLTGSLPFPGDNPYAALHHHRNTPAPKPSTLNYALTEEIDRMVLRLLSKDPADRPTAEELLNQLTDYQERVR
jgi:serine/threonine-protein kinase